MRAGSDRARRSVRIGKIMELTDIRELHREKDVYIGKEITVGGWVRNNRDSKNFGFLVINDGTFFEPLQVVYGDGLANFQEICKINVGAAVVIRGTIVATPEAKQAFEMQAAEVIVEGPSTADYPLQKKRHSFEYLRTISHLRARTNTFQAVFRVRTTQDFFGKPVNLTVSGQLDVETYAFAFKNVYTFGPTFRAENSNTTRHAAEFWMIEPEICFADLKDDMILAESMLKYVIRYVLENAPEEMAFFNQFVDKGLIERLQHVVNSDFGHVTYTEAIKILEKHNDEFDYKVFWGCDLQTEHERYLTEKEFKRPVFVTDYPKEIKAFYMKLNEDGKTVAAMDCLVPGIGEIIGGSQREDNLEILEKRMEELGLNKEDYQFYLDLRRYGSARHAGFGLGFERCVMYITGMGNIRDVIPFPRTVNNCDL